MSSLNTSFRAGYFDLMRANASASAGGFGGRGGYGGPRYGVGAFDTRRGKGGLRSEWRLRWQVEGKDPMEEGIRKGDGRRRVSVERRDTRLNRGGALGEREENESETLRKGESDIDEEIKSVEEEGKQGEVEDNMAKLNLQSKPINLHEPFEYQDQDRKQEKNRDRDQNQRNPDANGRNQPRPPAPARPTTEGDRGSDKYTNPPKESLATSHHNIKHKATDLILKQLGVLVPPSLRSAQSAFTAAVSEHVPAILNAMAEMRRLEGEVRELREQLMLAERKAREADGGPIEEDKRGDIEAD